MTTTTTTTTTPPPKLPRPFDDRAIGAFLEAITSGNRAAGEATIREVYARGLEHAGAVCALVRAHKQNDANALTDREEKKRARAAGFAVERVADALIRTSGLVRAGGDIAEEIDELRREVIGKGEPDPGTILGWLAVAPPPPPPGVPLDHADLVPGEARRCVGTLLARAPLFGLPANGLEVGMPVKVTATGYVRRIAEDRRPGGLHVSLEIVEGPGAQGMPAALVAEVVPAVTVFAGMPDDEDG